MPRGGEASTADNLAGRQGWERVKEGELDERRKKQDEREVTVLMS